MIGPKTTLTLKRITRTKDAAGGWTETEETIKTVKGVLSTIRGNERLSADKLTVIADYFFFTRYPRGFVVSESDEFWLDTRKFKIMHICNLGANQNRRLRIVLKEET